MTSDPEANAWRTVRSPRYSPGIRRAVDLSHELHCFPGSDPVVPPPPFEHVEPFGESVAERARAFDHVRIEPFHFSDSLDSRYAMVTICTQMDPQLEGPYLGYLPAHLYGDLDPKLKMVPKDPARYPLTQIVTSCAIIDCPTEPGGFIRLKDVQDRSQHVQFGDAVLMRTGFTDRYPESFDWPKLEAGITGWLAKEKGCLLFGIDSASVEGSSGGHLPIPNHLGMFMVGGINLEGLRNLQAISTDRCYLIAIPPRIVGMDAGPCRALAIVDENGRKSVVDLSPSIRANAGPLLNQPSYGAGRSEPFADKNEITRRLRVDPFHIDTCFDDVGMFVTFNTQLGTHVEIPPTSDVASFPIERLAGRAVILDIPVGPEEQVTSDLLSASGIEPREGEIAVIRTGYSDWNYGRHDFYDRSPSIAVDAIDWLVKHRVSAVATDCASIDAQKPLSGVEPDRKGLSKLFDAGIPAVLNLTNIAQVFTERPYVVMAPLRLEGIHACPVRAVAIEWT